MSRPLEEVESESFALLREWLASCTRGKSVSRNTVAVGVVVLDHLRQKCPVSRDDVVSPGGEIRGARAGLGDTLESYGISRNYLREVTTRQAPQDGQRLFEAFDWGRALMDLSAHARDDLLCRLADELAQIAREWLLRQNLKLDLNRRHAPSAWIHLILERAKGRSGGIVEQHLVGAKLEKRYTGAEIPNYAAHAGDVQTDRPGDFAVQNTVYHVTANPSPAVLEKCADNAKTGQHPILLVPREAEERACLLAELEGIQDWVSIVSIEDFLALNIIEMATGEASDFFAVMRDIVEIYNRRLVEVETDLSLKIDVR